MKLFPPARMDDARSRSDRDRRAKRRQAAPAGVPLEALSPLPLGGCELGKSIDKSQFRLPRLGTDADATVHIRCGLCNSASCVQRTRQDARAVSNCQRAEEPRWYKTNVERAGTLSLMLDGS